MSDLIKISVISMRGDTSFGTYWNSADLHCDSKNRDQVKQIAMGATECIGAEIDSSQARDIRGRTPVSLKQQYCQNQICQALV